MTGQARSEHPKHSAKSTASHRLVSKQEVA